MSDTIAVVIILFEILFVNLVIFYTFHKDAVDLARYIDDNTDAIRALEKEVRKEKE